MKVFLPLLLIMLSVAIYFMYITPMTLEVKGLVAEKSQYDDLLQKTQEIAQIRDKILSDYNSISEEEKTKLDKVVPETFVPVVFMNNLTSLAGRYALGISDLKTAEPDQAAGQVAIADPLAKKYKINKVSFKVNGQYAEFVRFLNDLETSLQLIDVTGLSIRSSVSNTSPVKDTALDYIIELNTYSLK